MSKAIHRLLAGEYDNHLMPFFWQHGEDEATLREYMRVIHESGCGAVCVESRPHPDFCGDKWWTDMDIILDEAQKRGMKVWILDDAHFPTGYANGAVKTAPTALCRQSICAVKNGEPFPPVFAPNRMEQFLLREPFRQFDDDKVISVVEFGGTKWTVGLTRNLGSHRNYINMLNAQSVKLLIDAVYEKHYEHYKDDFGKTIAGFFSDEPELGNGHLYDMECKLGTDNDFPFSNEVAAELAKTLGDNWADLMYLLWENNDDKSETARVRLAYMNAVTKLVRDNFSYQIGDWCHAHGVQYIGHIVEDCGAHSRTASSLGHYFRGLEGQDMAGIDDIGGQVYPQGENDNSVGMLGQKRDADFFHFTLGRLASSAAKIEKRKQGRAMCEIFGNYGWSEGVQLEKYLADHFMVCGVNYFVPHAFSPAPFPDRDCPPHFYAHGHNPQFKAFGELCRYMNRVCTLISSGERTADYAVLYHAEKEWVGKDFVSVDKIARVLEENQVSFDIVPQDYIDELENSGKYVKRDYKAVLTDIPDVDRLVVEVVLSPKSAYMRVLHIKGESEFYFFVNESAESYIGEITLPRNGRVYAYDAWANKTVSLTSVNGDNSTKIAVIIEPRKSLFVVFANEIPLTNIKRSACEGAEYPNFTGEKTVALPDNLADEQPEFSGFVRYTADFTANGEKSFVLEITDAAESVEVFVNGKSAGTHIVPKYVFDISEFVVLGRNELLIVVATTLERECFPLLDPHTKMRTPAPTAKSGITGVIRLTAN
jgi:hypothetical protein